ncbi:MAG: hypothetical protein ACRD26_17710, partial [Vicinamibacterales bacterium]
AVNDAASAAAFAIAVFTIAPITYLITVMGIGLDATSATILGAVTALAAWLVSPILELWPERPWRTAGIAGATTLLLFAAGAATERTSAKRPARAGLTYVVDADVGSAWLAGWATAPARPWLRQAIGAGMATDGASTPPAWVTRTFDRQFVRRAPYTPLPRATVRVVNDEATSNGRRLVLHVRPAPESVAVELDGTTSDVLSASVNGRPVDASRYRSTRARWELYYAAPTDDGFTIELVLTPAARSIALMSRRIGFPVSAGLRIPDHPEGVLAAEFGDSTIVHQIVEFSVLSQPD